jgi:hypothetical protein
MSEHEALLRFHHWCATWHGKVETRRLWRCRWVMGNAPTTFTSD